MELAIFKLSFSETIRCFAETISLRNPFHALAYKPFGKTKEEKD
jgi:hypothetical protein